MNKVSVVTSCSAKGWEKYGARFVATFDEYWPVEVDLHVVSEDFNSLEMSNLRRPGNVWSLDDPSGFLKRHWSDKWVAGDASMPRPDGVAPQWKGNKGYWFRYDAYKFCKKVFAIEQVVQQVKTGRLFWIDADVVTFAPVPIELCERMLPSDMAISCLARAGYHSECGFVGYNLDHPAARDFIREFSRLYASDEVFALPEWHDSWVFDWLRNKLNTPTYCIPHKSKSHPFINSELGMYTDHLKGGRKERGRSQSVEQIKNTKVPYWQRT